MRKESIHFRGFAVTVAWTLGLLFLGSVVHATQSSLACPDWPTCFGTLMPEMVGGVFWEHLHRLVAGGLILMFGLSTWLVWREAPERPWLFRLSLAGVVLLLVQAVMGGLTVLMQLPTAISTTHLMLAFAFLGVAVVLAAATSPWRAGRPPLDAPTQQVLRAWGGGGAALVLLQSFLGGVVRHMGAGMACPDLPTCLGRWVPPLTDPLVAVHFFHRLLGVIVALAVCAVAWRLFRVTRDRHVRRMAALAVGLVAVQFVLGLLSVSTLRAVAPLSLHTLVAAALFSVMVLLWVWGRLAAVEERNRPMGLGAGAATR